MLLCIILSSTSTAFASTIASPGGSGTTTTTSPDSGCYKEETDTTTKVTALTKVDNCANSTDYPNGDAINPNDCYYEAVQSCFAKVDRLYRMGKIVPR